MENPPPPASSSSEDAAIDNIVNDDTLSRRETALSDSAQKSEQDITADVGNLPSEPVAVLRQTYSQAEEESLPVIGLSIHLPGRKEPITIKSIDPVVIGRKDRGSNVAPTIDLADDHAALLGVSRRHAEMVIKDKQCFIRDLDSANGTWLNEKSLPPHEEYRVHNGDQIRFGHLICFIYLIYARSTSELTALEETVTAVRLVDSDLKTGQLRTGLSSHYLMSTLGNFLDAVIGLQMLLNQIYADLQPDAAIKSFNIDQPRKQIQVELKNVREIIAFLNRKSDIWQTTVFDDSQTTATALQLANALWNTLDISPDAQRGYYIGLMQGHFTTLVRSNLKLVVDHSNETD